MTIRELKQRLDEFPDSYEVYVKPCIRRVYLKSCDVDKPTTNIVIQSDTTFKRVYLK